MARSVKLRELRGGERKMLRAKLRDLSLAARIHQRYRVIEEVRRGRSIMEAAERAGCHFTIAYDWLHRFNRSGFVSFEQVANPKGRPPIVRATQLRELVDVALSSPAPSAGCRFRCGRSPNWPSTAATASCWRRSATSGSGDCCGARVSPRSESVPGRPPPIPTSTRKNHDSPALSPAPPAVGGSMLRRVGPARTAPPGRHRLGAPPPPAPAARRLSSRPPNRAVPRLLRCPCGLPERGLSPAQARGRTVRRLSAAAALLSTHPAVGGARPPAQRA